MGFLDKFGPPGKKKGDKRDKIKRQSGSQSGEEQDSLSLGGGSPRARARDEEQAAAGARSTQSGPASSRMGSSKSSSKSSNGTAGSGSPPDGGSKGTLARLGWGPGASRETRTPERQPLDNESAWDYLEDRADSESRVEVFQEDKRKKRIVTLFTVAMGLMAIIGCIAILFLFLGILRGTPDSASDVSAAQQAQQAAEPVARGHAESFTAAYLRVNPGESDTSIQERITPYLASDLPAEEVAPSVSGEGARGVVSVSSSEATALSDGTWRVRTEALIESSFGGGSDDSSSSEDSPALERVALDVYVGTQPDGSAAIVEYPRFADPSQSTEGIARGVLSSPEGAGELEEDGPAADLLNSYFSAAYGDSDSRSGLESYFYEGADPLPLPPEGYSFSSLEDALFYPTEPPENATEAYQVSAFIIVTDDESGISATQTVLMEIVNGPEGWQINGPIEGQTPG